MPTLRQSATSPRLCREFVPDFENFILPWWQQHKTYI